MDNIEVIICTLESELKLHEGKVYIPVNRQILEDIVRSLKDEQEAKLVELVAPKLTTKRTTKRTTKKN